LERVRVLVTAVALGLLFAEGAFACVCADTPLEQRFEEAQLAFVGRYESERPAEVRGQRITLLTVAVEQRVKGDVEGTVEVRSPSGSDCDLTFPERRSVGLLLARAPDGAWLGSACSIVEPGELVAVGGEPRGGVIKVAIGLVVLALVLAWALRRRARGARPSLPGAPRT
jgi:MYXO-CTERM domain-containing protein